MKKHILIALSASMILMPVFSYAVTVGPAKLEYTVDPGSVMKGQLFLLNESSEAKTFYPTFEKFTEGSNGEKRFTKEESDLATWFDVAPSIALSPGDNRQVPFTITVPQGAPPGGHFAVIWWSTTPPGKSKEQVSIVTRAGILVYLTVTGDVQESASISWFGAVKRFFGSLPIDFSFIFKNTGNSYVRPSGEVRVKNILGSVKEVIPVNPHGALVLPQAEKSFALTLGSSAFFFGPYRAELDLTYGEKQQKLSESFWVLVLPWKALLLVVALLFLVLFVIPRGIKKYNKWIIHKSRG